MENLRKNTRDLPLDFVKGILVIVMVIYHIMNYFSTAGDVEFGYVRFVTGSFIFVSGYIIAVFYEKKLQANRTETSRRLITRGIKLLMVFIILNVLISLTGIGNPYKMYNGTYRFFSIMPDIFVFGTPQIVSFQILLPISYLLIISPILLMLPPYWKYIIIIALIVGMWFISFDHDNVILGLLPFGLIGVVIGTGISSLKKQYVIPNKTIIYCLLVAVCCSLSYMSRNDILYVLSIIILLKLLYDIARKSDLEWSLCSAIIIFGQYSLICYIVQIVFLHGLQIIFGHQRVSFGYELIVIFCITNVFLLIFCKMLSMCRSQFRTVDNFYKFIF
jgi:uncharacterized membrane protein